MKAKLEKKRLEEEAKAEEERKKQELERLLKQREKEKQENNTPMIKKISKILVSKVNTNRSRKPMLRGKTMSLNFSPGAIKNKVGQKLLQMRNSNLSNTLKLKKK